MARALAEKVGDVHVVRSDGAQDLLYVDLHLLHEINTPVAFDPRNAQRPRRPCPTWPCDRARSRATSTSTRCSSAPAPTAASRTCRAAAEVLRGRTAAPGVEVYVVPGSDTVRDQAVAEGLDEVFTAAGIQLRTSGCSLSAAVNEDRLRPAQHAASTNNRNFEGRQGKGARTRRRLSRRRHRPPHRPRRPRAVDAGVHRAHRTSSTAASDVDTDQIIRSAT